MYCLSTLVSPGMLLIPGAAPEESSLLPDPGSKICMEGQERSTQVLGKLRPFPEKPFMKSWI